MQALGVFVCFNEQVTKLKISESKSVGYYAKDIFVTVYDKIQILTVEDLLSVKRLKIPTSSQGKLSQPQRKLLMI